MTSKSYTESELDAMPDRLAATFSGKTVLITGGTGFMGKVLIEKLLRKSPDIRQIILIARSKRGKTSQERIEELFHHDLFKMARETRGGVEPLFKQTTLVSGDMMAPDLAISPDDRRMIIDSVDIIIHAAASVRFDEPLKKVVLLNVRGTKLILDLAKECKNLKLFMHVSTAYCHTYEKMLEERPYPPPADPHKMIDLVQWMDEEILLVMTPKLLNNLPNSYAFTKSLGEALVVEAMGEVPAIIVRPSIVIPIYKEPLPGWTDNINGPTGLLIGAGKGVLRSMYCKGGSNADFLPADVFVNGVMLIAWSYLDCGHRTHTVINLTSTADIKISWEEIINVGKDVLANRVPFNGIAWYPGGEMTQSRFRHNMNVYLFQLLPALLVDAFLYCIGYEPVLMKVQRRIVNGYEIFEYYANNEWHFKSDTVQNLRKLFNPREKRDYKVDAEDVDIPKYLEDCIRASRLYILKEPEDTIPAAKRHLKVMYILYIVSCCLFWGLMLYWFSGWMSALYSFVFGSGDTITATAHRFKV